MRRFARVSLLLLLVACSSSPPQTAATPYGACPRKHEATIRAYFQDKDSGSTTYKDELVFWPPEQFAYTMPALLGGDVVRGYLVAVAAEQTSGPSETRGLRLYGFVFHGDELVKRLGPAIMESLSLQSQVGPMPRDERNWRVGRSKNVKDGSYVEYLPADAAAGSSAERVLMQTFRGVVLQVTPQDVYDQTIVEAKGLCGERRAVVLSSSPTGLVWESDLTRCAARPDEFAIGKFIRAPTAMFSVHYSRATPFTDEERAKWTEIIGRAHVLGDCGE
jgi:hypothetical protein